MRDVVLVYHIDPAKTGPKVVAACPGAVVGVEVFAPLEGHYNVGKGLTALPDAIEAMQLASGAQWRPGLVVLVGFSEGCQALRSLLVAGAWPSALVAIDGMHASNPPSTAQIEPVKRYFDAARDRTRIGYLTHTAIEIPGRKYLSTTEVAQLVAPMGAGALRGTADHPGGLHATAEDGWLFVDSWPGKDAQAHISQQVNVLPYVVEWTLSAARVAREYLPAQLGGRGPGPGPTGGGGGPPAPSRPPPSPPAGGGGGGGLGAAPWLLGLLGVGLLLRRAHR